MQQSVRSQRNRIMLGVQAAVVLLVAAVVVVGIVAQSPVSDMAATLNPAPTAAAAAQPRLVFNLAAGRLSNAATLGLLDTQGISTTMQVNVPLAATFTWQRGRLVGFATNRNNTQVFTTTYVVQALDGSPPRQFNTSTTNVTPLIGEAYFYNPALLSPDSQSIAYLRTHRSFVDAGTRIRLEWTLSRVQLAEGSQQVIASGEITAERTPAVNTLVWANDDRIYLTVQQGEITTIYSYPASGGDGQQIATTGGFPFPAPDGSKLAWLELDANTPLMEMEYVNRLSILDVQSGAKRSVAAAAGNYLEPTLAWSPDSRNVAYIEHLANITPTADGKTSNIFYEIALKRLNVAGDTIPTTIANFRSANAMVASTKTGGVQFYWCGNRLYLPLTHYTGSVPQGTLYIVAADGRGGLRPLAESWSYPILGCEGP